MTKEEMYQAIVDAAEAHGQADDPDHEVGDLQDALRIACELLAIEQVAILHEVYFEEHGEEI